MKLLIKNKKNIILLVVLILIIAVGGIFWRLKSQREEEFFVKFEPPENYVIKETPEGKIVENQKIGLNFKVPEDWNLEKTDKITWSGGINEYGIRIFTSDFKIHPRSPWILIPFEGCLINIYTFYNRAKADFIREDIKSVQAIRDEKKEVIEINNHSGMKYIYGDFDALSTNSYAFVMLNIEIPINDRIYALETYISAKNKERCLQEFDKFLETFLIVKTI